MTGRWSSSRWGEFRHDNVARLLNTSAQPGLVLDTNAGEVAKMYVPVDLG